MANEALGAFDAELTANALFDPENAPDGLFDHELVKAAGGASFDPALMAAMAQQQSAPTLGSVYV